jgi:putative FmdB family regulatory protein
MPTYEYACEACGRTFEKFQSIKAAPLRKCIHCGKPRARRQISTGAGVIFKGSGFYITDYRSESYKQAAKKDAAPTPADAKPAADTKPAGKAETAAAPAKAVAKSAGASKATKAK